MFHAAHVARRFGIRLTSECSVAVLACVVKHRSTRSSSSVAPDLPARSSANDVGACVAKMTKSKRCSSLLAVRTTKPSSLDPLTLCTGVLRWRWPAGSASMIVET